MRTAPGLMRVISGVWRGRMPSSPFSPGRATNLASPEKMLFGGNDVDVNGGHGVP
jgi:hypothetical protein